MNLQNMCYLPLDNVQDNKKLSLYVFQSFQYLQFEFTPQKYMGVSSGNIGSQSKRPFVSTHWLKKISSTNVRKMLTFSFLNSKRRTCSVRDYSKISGFITFLGPMTFITHWRFSDAHYRQFCRFTKLFKHNVLFTWNKLIFTK